MNKSWKEELQNENYTVGPMFNPGPNPLGWGEHYEVRFPNGTIALVDKRYEHIQAVKVPGKRGHRLHVNGLSHWKKWGSIKKGAGLAWTGRKTWTSLQCRWALWQLCKTAVV